MNKTTARSAALDNLNTDFVKAFCEPARIEILKLLIVMGPSDVKTLAEKMPQDRSVISRHLAVLHQAGFLDHEKQGRYSLYRVNGEGTLKMAEQFAKTIRTCVQSGCC
jgi:predicted transcriptional regulator